MRVFVLSLLVGVALAMPQGYNYQVHLGPSDNNEFTLAQYQLLQQFVDQQQTQQQQQQFSPQQFQLPANAQIIAIQDNSAAVNSISQTVTQSAETGGYEFANQPVQPSQIAQYEQQPQQQQPQQQQQIEVAPQQEPVQSIQPPEQEQLLSKTLAPNESPLDLHIEHQQAQIAQPAAISAPELPAPAPAPTQTQHYQPAPLQYNKEFYYLSAPQEDYDQSPDLQNELGKLKKNIRVVFIKAPEQNGLAKAALQLAQGANSAQTAIYVLTKQHDVGELASKLQQIRTSTHTKPDVVFVKYRTPEEAEQAQRTIQAQYEALDGPNHFNHEGVVPTHNFIGSTSVIEPRQRPVEETAKPVAKYLPAAAKL